MKPFKPLTRINKPGFNNLSGPPPAEPPTKKRRISHETGEDDAEAIKAAAEVLKQQKPRKAFVAPARKPLDPISNPSGTWDTSRAPSGTGTECYFTVLWRKFTTKKNKTWDGDGVLSVSGGYATLQDISGKEFGRAVCKTPLMIGSELSIGGKEIEIEAMITREDFTSGRIFLGNVKKPAPTLQEIDQTLRPTLKAQAKHEKIAAAQKDLPSLAAPASKASKTAFKNPLLNSTVQSQKKHSKAPTSRHDPKAEGALVMKRPRTVPKDKQIVDVVVDPILTKNLREHQRAGVSFLYECVMGMKDYDGEGAILADEMGLGKTLQTIALLWTLLKQNPIYGDEPVIKKALIVCPVTLINNWRKEIRKWLGNERVGVFVAENKKMRLTDFTMGKSYSIMIIGYEKLRLVQDELKKGAGIDIVIADEGHRLKTAQNKSAMAIKSLNTERRVILSGTPIQNDLAEFYTMVDFVNPGLLNKYSTFKREFENPILKSRQPGASAKDLEKGESRGEELKMITNMFILRRTSEILSKYLPPKTEYVVFCRPTKIQASVYSAITGSSIFNAALGASALSLELINILKKVCNCPTLLMKRDENGEQSTKSELLSQISPASLKSPGASGKLQVLDSLLHCIRTTTQEKVVLVSNYTSTMDILANLLNALSYSYLRLDGKTPPNKRQDLVDRFNRSPPSNSFVFLLSAKAGGTGLNLIGASRLVLFDLDWNPATDLQAMARVHRDGQKMPCYIYRLVTQGAIDEKIFQRQVSKTGLADSIVDGKSGVSGFSRDELRDLFTLDEGQDCQTHKLLSCGCGGKGLLSADPSAEANSPRDDPVELNDGIETINMTEDDEVELPNFPIKASQYDWRAQEAEIQRKAKECKDSTGKTKMLSLMQYTHFDTIHIGAKYNDGLNDRPEDEKVDEDDDETAAGPTSGLDLLDTAIEDLALRSALREDGKRVGHVFAKMSS